MMGSDKSDDVHEPTKLSLLISRPTMPPEIPTPPPQTTVSVPFKWEEAPGKPRHCHTQSEPNCSASARTLELPPRLVFSKAKVSNMDVPSPTTVLNGPYVGRAMSFTSSYSYRTPRDYWNVNFGSTRWSSFRNNNWDDTGGIFDFSGHSSHGTTKPKVKITRVPTIGSFFSLSQSKARSSHLWASIYQSFKQVVPWRRRQEKQRKWASKIATV